MRMVASFFYVGFLRPAPGTWGSLAGVLTAWAVHLAGGFWLLSLLTALGFAAGLIASARVLEGTDDPDPGWIVIDEVVGQWLALFPVSFGAGMMGIDVLRLWPGIVSAFVLFRVLDIWKPWIIGRADRRGGAVGVMLDDVLAGLGAALGTIALAALFHGVLT